MTHPMIDAVRTKRDDDMLSARYNYSIPCTDKLGHVVMWGHAYEDKYGCLGTEVIYFAIVRVNNDGFWSVGSMDMNVHYSKDNMRRIYQACRLMARGVNPDDAMAHALVGLSPGTCRMLWERAPGFTKVADIFSRCESDRELCEWLVSHAFTTTSEAGTKRRVYVRRAGKYNESFSVHLSINGDWFMGVGESNAADILYFITRMLGNEFKVTENKEEESTA